MDEAHEWTDDRIEELERRFADVYRQASEEMRSKLETHMALFDAENRKWQERVESGEATKAEYDKWLYQWTTDRDFIDGLGRRLAADAVNADRIAAGYINDELPGVYAENANAAAWQIEKGLGWDTHSFDLYDVDTARLLIAEDRELVRFVTPDGAEDLSWNRRKFNSAITQSVLHGESIPHTAERLQRVLGMDESAAVRSARTAMTSAENAGRIDSYKRAEAAGIELMQQWMATPDMRTRPSHIALDGKKVKVGESFKAAGGKLRYPGDPSGAPEEVYNCRCTLVAWFPGIEQEDPARWTRLPDGMTYEDWKNGKKEPKTAPTGARIDDYIGTAVYDPSFEDIEERREKDLRMAKDELEDSKKILQANGISSGKDIRKLEEKKLAMSSDIEAKRSKRDKLEIMSPEWTKLDDEIFDMETEEMLMDRTIRDVKSSLESLGEKEKRVREAEDALARAKEEYEPLLRRWNERPIETLEPPSWAAESGVKVTREVISTPGGNRGEYLPARRCDVYTTSDGHRFVFPTGMKTRDQAMEPERAIELFGRVPKDVAKFTNRDIYFVDYENPMDDYWRRAYSNFSRSYATGGKEITFYASDSHRSDYVVYTYEHETGHQIDTKFSRLSSSKKWEDAMESDLAESGMRSPTDYGRNSNEEDIAESIATFCTRHEWFSENFPSRCTIINEVLYGDGGGL